MGIVECEIINILLSYGNISEKFEGVLIGTNPEGEVGEVVVKKERKVYEEIYLSLQEDEIEFATGLFKEIYK